MATFVLIHGTFQGSWTWQALAERMQAMGHKVYRPTLDGCAERAAGLRPEITSITWGKEVAALIFFEDLKDVILVGTSMGGVPLAHAAQEVPERIQRLVLIDAMLPIPGETLAQVGNRPLWDASKLVYDGKHAFMDIESPELKAWARARYTSQPRIPSDGPLDVEKFWSLKWKADVIRCTQHASPPEAHQRRNAERLGARFSTFEAGHYPMLTHTEQLAGLLDRFSRE